MSAESEQLIRSFNDLRTETLRTVQNRRYVGRGASVLTGGKLRSPEADARWPWLLAGKTRMHILGQLGRVRQDEALKIFADCLCKLKPSAKDATRLVRRWRDKLETRLAIAVVQGREFDIEAIARSACDLPKG